ncbi:fibronectin type III domain-containing protein [Sphaerotilus mobilis]|uniref:Fibronectin type III domain protein n=1 Tax=Sphaerotilus mobilis TaxID=47994 RepID=A0A4Q7LGW2_9BURK|nr:fibronectin type III domain-containing protein [Sphaerotilus mobilis]RZS53291.1 fibronectin type III domain protein [Sphaerotilus mobilis]
MSHNRLLKRHKTRALGAALLAGALELGAAGLAHAACPAPNGATPFATGPVNPIDSYPESVTDSRGLSLQICRNADLCFFDPAIPGNLVSAQTGTGTESFYWLAEASLAEPTRGFDALVVMATEATYTTEEPTAGEQLTFTRLRIRLDVPQTGIYRVEHPYGVEQYRIEALEPGRDLSETFDLSFVANDPVAQGKVGPWLTWDPVLAPPPPAGYIGDGATPQPVVGSPCDTNFLRVTATDFNGLPIAINAAGGNVVQTNLFVVQGQLFDGRVQTPLSADRVTYSRTPARVGQIDAFAHALAGANVTVQDVEGTPPEAARLPSPAPLTGNATGEFFTTEVLADAPNTTALPGAVSLVASVADASTDTTRLVRALVDQVVVTQADYDLSTNTLTVNASSSDSRVPPTLTVQDYLQPLGPNGVAIRTDAPPSVITVMSSAGGWDRAQVRTVRSVAPALPAAPQALSVRAVSPTQVDLTWTDAATNETGFEVLRNGVALASLAANTTTFSDTAAPSGQTLSYQVVALNAAGRSPSNPVSVATPVPILIVAPTGLSVSAGTVANSALLRWTDASSGETAYRVQRAPVTVAANGTATIGAYATITTPSGNLPANASQVQNTGLAANALYSYRVNAVNGATQGPTAVVPRFNGNLPLPANFRSTVTAGGLLGIGATPAGRVPLAWTASTLAAVAGYDIERCTGTVAQCNVATASWTAVTRVNGRATATFAVNGLTSGQPYSFRIRTHTGAIGLTSTWSAPIQGTPR